MLWRNCECFERTACTNKQQTRSGLYRMYNDTYFAIYTNWLQWLSSTREQATIFSEQPFNSTQGKDFSLRKWSGRSRLWTKQHVLEVSRALTHSPASWTWHQHIAWPKRVVRYRLTYDCMVMACLCPQWVVTAGLKRSSRTVSVYDVRKHSDR